MTGNSTIVPGLVVASSDPVFPVVVGVHVLLGLACTITGIVAMLSEKRAGRHPLFGSVYYWCLVGVFVTASGLAAVRWREDYQLFILGALAFAYLGRRARRKRWNNWAKLHITGMGSSYVLGRTCPFGESRLHDASTRNDMARRANRRIPIEASSGNVFADELIAAQRLAQVTAAARLEISQPKISALKNYRLDGFSVERLMNFLLALGQEVKISIRPRKTAGSQAKILVEGP